MVDPTKHSAEEQDFIGLLEKTRILTLSFFRGKKTPSSEDFEKIVCEQMVGAAKGTQFEGTIKQTGTYEFPDILVKKFFGVEVKMTTKDHWTSTGNSILETSRIEDAERVYILFGKFGGKLDIRHRLYQECLPEVSVTHSPRYRINMALASGESIFDKIGIDYDTLRKGKNTIKTMKNYYRSQLRKGEELWWIDQQDGAIPIIKPFRNLSDAQQENFIVEAMILFPEIFGKSRTKFEGVAAYLMAEYGAVSPHVRDLFTASGKETLSIKNTSVEVPQIAFRLQQRAKAIAKKIEIMDDERLKLYWQSEKLEKVRLHQWKKLLDENFALIEPSVLASDIFDAGLL